MWQDYVLAAVNVAFCFTLVPTLLSPRKPPFSTALSTGLLLVAAAATMATLALWLAAASQLVVGIEWLVIGVQVRARPRTIE